MKNISKDNALATVVTSHEVEVFEVNTDSRSYVRLGWLIVLVGVVGFFIWASVAPLDKGAPAQGIVSVASGRKLIQHQTGGTIEDILVKEGDKVKAGQILVKMNGVSAQASSDIVNVQWYTAMATEARLVAERDGLKGINFPKALTQQKNHLQVQEMIALQQQLFTARQISFQSEISAIDENIAGYKSQLKGIEEAMIEKKHQLGFSKEQLESLRDLAKDGYIARNRLLDLERSHAQLTGNISEDAGNIGRVLRQVNELNLRKIQRQQDYQKEVRTQLADVQKEVDALKSKSDAVNFELDNTIVKSPVDGTVIGMNVFTKGGVVSGGYKLMEIVPAGDALVVEGMLGVQLIDKVHTGLKVDFIFAAFNTNTTPHIPGVITQVSADRSIEERTGQPYYKFKAVVTEEGLKKLGQLQIRPGMPVEMSIKTGERTMMNYLMRPILDRAHSAMKEE